MKTGEVVGVASLEAWFSAGGEQLRGAAVSNNLSRHFAIHEQCITLGLEHCGGWTNGIISENIHLLVKHHN